jgi:hypothetical protein
VTHTYTQAIKQPTLHCLTRSVRRRAATSKHGYRQFETPANSSVETATPRSSVGRAPAYIESALFLCEWECARARKCFRIKWLQGWACSSAGRASALQAGGRRFDPGHVHQLLRCLQCTYQIHLCSNPSVLPPTVHELCTNPVIAVRLCTLELPTERQRPPVLFRWLDGLAFPELRASSATSFGNTS